ncbi:MAG: Abi family protein [Thiomicrospira sp.]
MSLIEYKKHWLSFDEQLEQLTQRGLSVTDPNKALEGLKRIGYYRLSGYFYSLKQRCEPCCFIDDPNNIKVCKGLKQSEKVVKNEVVDFFKPGASFQDAVHLYVFDKKLRLLALDGLERIEVGLRVDIAYTLGEHGAFSYLNPDCLARHFTQELDPKSNTTGFVDWMNHQARQVARSKEEFIVAYNKKYYQPVPIWMACELWDFGTLSKLYAGMLPDDQRKIASRYGISDPKVMVSWIRSLNYLRNVCAHHSRLWNRNMTEQPKKPKPSEAPLFEQAWNDAHSLARPFLGLCLIQFYLCTINPTSSWWRRLTELLNTFPELEHLGIDLKAMGVIEGWKDWRW